MPHTARPALTCFTKRSHACIRMFSGVVLITFSSLYHHDRFLPALMNVVGMLREETNFLQLKNYTILHSQSDYSSPAIIYQCPTGSLIEWGTIKGKQRAGLSDFRTGVISTFLVSLLLRMPFFIDCHVFSELYEENMINWKWHGAGQYSAKNGTVKYLDQYNVANSFIDDIDRCVQNVVQSNRGIIARLEDSSIEELKKWGLSRQSAFSVAHNYLFKSKKELQLHGVEKTRMSPMINLQIRIGDEEIHGSCRSDAQECPLSEEKKAFVQQFVKCTSKVHRSRNLTKSTIYILSDCECLKNQLKSQFESTLDTEVLVEKEPAVTRGEYDKTHVMHSFMGALSEATRAEFFVISRKSGVGRQVVALAQKFDHTFWGDMGDQCEALDFNAVAHGWSGL